MIFLGSLVLALGIPAGAWLLITRFGHVSVVYWLVLPGCPLAMVAWGILLGRLNRAYVGRRADDDEHPQDGGVLEASLVVAVLAAIILLVAFLILFPQEGQDFKGFTPA